MKNRFNLKNIILPVLLLSMAAVFSRCSDWTQTEGVDITVPKINDTNNELYQQYLKSLREYKTTYHPIVIGWFDNSNKAPSSRGSHLAALPDSVDIVSLMYPDNLTANEMSEKSALQSDMATKVIFTINYDAAEKAINQQIADAITAGTTPVDYMTTMSDYLDSQLALIGKYGYDGVSLGYIGKSTQFLTPANVAILQAKQDQIFEKLNTVPAGKIKILEGSPENVIDKSKLSMFSYLVLQTYGAVDLLSLEMMAYSTVNHQGVLSDRIIISVIAKSTDPTDVKTGTFLPPSTDAVRPSAIEQTAYWVKTPDVFTKAGLGIYRINDDYYNTGADYKYTREAIRIMNPSPKN